MSVTIEICVEGIESALAASAGGADRVELCENLAVGGVTPSLGTIAVACRRLTIPVHVLIRPRGGDFEYSEAELEVMRHDIAAAKSQGASGVVLGLLRPDHSLDRTRLKPLIAAARPMEVTFHRAFDEVSDPFAVMEELIQLGVDRILTSGGLAQAVDSLERLSALVVRGADQIAVAAGGRIAVPDLPAFLDAGLRHIHLGLAACTEGQVDATKVRQIVQVIRQWQRECDSNK